ncbi:MAG: T9SS type A sorting domain-containing protein, partial [Bacteroidetes bacterium]|nr:T9SS type A sorting domain-containing protein [Bacteroidota bacterium]
ENNYVITGAYSYSSEDALWVCKVSGSTGAIQWSRSFEFDDTYQSGFDVWYEGFDIIQTDDEQYVGLNQPFQHDGFSDDGYIVVGSKDIVTGTPSVHSYSAIALKLDYSGNYENSSTYHANGGSPQTECIGFSIIETDNDGDGLMDNGYTIAGWAGKNYRAGGPWHGLILKIEEDLSYDWARIIAHNTPNTQFWDVIESGNNLYFTGPTFGNLLVKTSISGTLSFFKTWESNGSSISLTELSSGNILESGWVNLGSTTASISLATFDSNGSSDECKEESPEYTNSTISYVNFEDYLDLLDALEDIDDVSATRNSHEPKSKYACGVEVSIYKGNSSNPDASQNVADLQNWEFLIMNSNGDEIIVSTDANGLWSGNLSNLHDIVIKEIFQKDYVVVTPQPAQYSITAGTTAPQTFQFINYEFEDICPLFDGMVAYFHFQEKDGDFTMNLLGDNGIFKWNSSGNPINGTGTIGWNAGDPVVKTTGGVSTPYHTNTRTFYLKKDNVNKTSDNVFIEVPNYSDISTIGDGDFTVEFYLQVDNMQNSGHGGIVQKEIRNAGGSPTNGWDIDLQKSATGVYQIHPHFHGVSPTNWYTTSISDGNMYHIAVTKKALSATSIQIELYIDGTSQGTKTYNHAIGLSFNTNAPLEIMPDFFDGLIDELSIYNRVLSSSEISTIVNDGKCWDYVRFNEYTQDCSSGNESKGSFTVYNGRLSATDFRYSLAEMPSGTDAYSWTAKTWSTSNVNGPVNFDDNNGSVTVAYNDYKTELYEIPCKSTYSSSDLGAYRVNVLNDINWVHVGMGTNHIGSSLNIGSSPYDESDDKNITEDYLELKMNSSRTALEVEQVTSAHSFSFYPNPAISKIQVLSDLERIDVRILSVDGKEMISTQRITQNHQTLDISDLQSGVYLIEITTDSNTVIERITKL